MLKQGITLSILAAIVVAAACGSSDDSTSPPVSKVVNLTATLLPGNEPSVTGNPTGSGTFTGTLDTSTHVFTWNVTFTGLTANASLGHIHGPFTPGSTGSAGVILNFDPSVSTGGTFTNVTFTGLKTATSGSATGSVTLTNALSLTSTIKGDSLEKLLLAGAVYANIHTATNPGGEIRGQISKK